MNPVLLGFLRVFVYVIFRSRYSIYWPIWIRQAKCECCSGANGVIYYLQINEKKNVCTWKLWNLISSIVSVASFQIKDVNIRALISELAFKDNQAKVEFNLRAFFDYLIIMSSWLKRLSLFNGHNQYLGNWPIMISSSLTLDAIYGLY